MKEAHRAESGKVLNAKLLLSCFCGVGTHYFPHTSAWSYACFIADQGSSPKPWPSEFVLGRSYIGRIDRLMSMWLISVWRLTETLWPKPPTLNHIVAFSGMASLYPKSYRLSSMTQVSERLPTSQGNRDYAPDLLLAGVRLFATQWKRMMSGSEGAKVSN